MPSLRASQVETLRAVARLERSTTAHISSLAVAVEQGRGEHATEKSLMRLAELGYLDRSYQWLGGSGRSTYRLTQLGHEALEGSDA
jgi:hypothetical protein